MDAAKRARIRHGLSRRYGLAPGADGAGRCVDAVVRDLQVHPAHVEIADALATVALLAEARQDLDAAETALLEHARAHGATWQALADALGVSSRQAAQQRAARSSRPRSGSAGAEVA